MNEVYEDRGAVPGSNANNGISIFQVFRDMGRLEGGHNELSSRVERLEKMMTETSNRIESKLDALMAKLVVVEITQARGAGIGQGGWKVAGGVAAAAAAIGGIVATLLGGHTHIP